MKLTRHLMKLTCASSKPFRLRRNTMGTHREGDLFRRTAFAIRPLSCLNAGMSETSRREVRAGLEPCLPRLWRYALLLSRARDVADDLVQATCLRAIERADQFVSGTRLDRWLFSILRSIWLNEVRARRIREGGGFVDPEVGSPRGRRARDRGEYPGVSGVTGDRPAAGGATGNSSSGVRGRLQLR